MATIDRAHLKKLTAIEEERFLKLHPKSGALFEQAKEVMPGGVPMSWMAKWPGAYPVFVKSAHGARFTDVDGIEYVDFCLGDTGSMTGHSPAPTVAAIIEQMQHGFTAMLPTYSSLWFTSMAIYGHRHRCQSPLTSLLPLDYWQEQGDRD